MIFIIMITMIMIMMMVIIMIITCTFVTVLLNVWAPLGAMSSIFSTISKSSK